jgi:hypothetical protein
LGSGY